MPSAAISTTVTTEAVVVTSTTTPWRVQIPMADLEIDEFVLWREQQRQKNVIETQKPMPHTPCNYFWTRRMTGTDIISMITTTKPIGAGQLKEDIGPEWAETKKGEKFLKKNVVSSKTPFASASGISADAISEKEKQRINRGLWKEHKEFMEKLHRKRTQRARLEGYAVTRIQSLFRAWTVRRHWPALHSQLILRREIRSDLRDLLSSNNLVLQGVEYRRRKMERRQHAAVIIQSAYRRMLSYRALDRKRVIRYTERRREAATRVQCLVRGWRSGMLTSKLRERTRQEHRMNAATRIQSVFRGSLGRKKYRVVVRLLQKEAAVMIQCAWRQKRARIRVRTVRSTSQDKSREFGTKCIQRVCRGFLGRQRVRRLRAERRERRKDWAVLMVQTCMRKWRGRARVAVRRARIRQVRRLWAILHVQRVVRGFVGRKRAYNKKLLLSIDIWAQVRLGDDVLVEDIYTGVDTEQPLTPDTKDSMGNTLLILAARYGHLKIVRKCLQWGVKLNAMNQKGQTALHVAIAHRHAAVAEYLLSKPEAMVSKSGRTLLHEAAKGGLHHCALNLVNYGVDVDAVDPMTGRTALHEACKHGQAAILRLVLQESVKSVNVQDKEGNTPLHWAAMRGSLECATQLVQCGATVKMVDTHGRPPIVYALLGGYESLCKKLESIWPSSVNSKDSMQALQQWTHADHDAALRLAEKGLVGLLGKLLDLGLPIDGPPLQPSQQASSAASPRHHKKAAAPQSPKQGGGGKKQKQVQVQQQQQVVEEETVLLRAAKHGRRDVMVMAIQRGANVNKTTSKGQCFLHLLFQHHPATSPLGLSCSSSLPLLLTPATMPTLFMVDKDGRSPLHYAAANGYAIETVVKKGSKALVDVNLPDKTPAALTPLHMAAANVCLQGIKTILALGADVTAVDSLHKRNALHTLAAAPPTSPGLKDCVAALLATSIPLSARDATCNATALVLAATCGNAPVTEALLPKAGNNAKERNEAVFAAVRAGRVSCLEVLNPDVTGLRDDSAAGGGLTLLGYAIREGRHEAMTWLLSKGGASATSSGSTDSSGVVIVEGSTGRTAMHMVARHGTVRTLEALLQHQQGGGGGGGKGNSSKVSLEEKDTAGYTPLTHAILTGNYPVADALIRRGALAKPALQAGTWGWVLATVKLQERSSSNSSKTKASS